MPKPFYLRFIKFPVGITVKLRLFACNFFMWGKNSRAAQAERRSRLSFARYNVLTRRAMQKQSTMPF